MLTDKAIKAAAVKDKPYKITDGHGLFLHVSIKGHKTFRFKFRFEKKEQLLVIGAYPEISLADARERRNDARKLLREGRDPRHSFNRLKLVGEAAGTKSFETLAREWHDLRQSHWKPVHAKDVITSLERDVFPLLGPMPLTEIDEQLLLKVLRKVEDRGAIETARRLKQRISSVFLYARGLGIKVDNPAAHIGEALKPVPHSRKFAAIVTVDGIRRLISDTDRAGASPVTRLGARFLALTCQRPGMVRHLEWSDLAGVDWGDPSADSPEALWTVPTSKLKIELKLRANDEFNHKVPLAPQAVETLRAVRWLTGRDQYVFPNSLSGFKPMSENAIGYLYNREGYRGRHVPHGWRSSFSTIMNEMAERELGQDRRLLADRLIIDLMLAHKPSGMSADEFVYNRASYMPRRRELAGIWADMIMEGALDSHEIVNSPRRKQRD
ncbi:MAG: integrase arm-type DNA-binding domain-containing protein [Sphingomonadales bacterium]|nr:integrase arm-type DNA-binding domain-containing protein [Sphingomonadales bacterium]NCO50447.1 integrase arm-type DNA-binding domain-containing protein [Sphingomonadales bacterium]NCP27398.1 integrase arm-type DNA-binding domain-containing protein [Sphingomonadales bacterium]NCP42465.1 integrase arm-type DNA-binding domain-containing protein [Sphingomonadales bacterium]NCP48809.1 integrase arm-type DNA-binding domain-containing protein [Sphingomonadales bacterium]